MEPTGMTIFTCIVLGIPAAAIVIALFGGAFVNWLIEQANYEYIARHRYSSIDLPRYESNMDKWGRYK